MNLQSTEIKLWSIYLSIYHLFLELAMLMKVEIFIWDLLLPRKGYKILESACTCMSETTLQTVSILIYRGSTLLGDSTIGWWRSQSMESGHVCMRVQCYTFLLQMFLHLYISLAVQPRKWLVEWEEVTAFSGGWIAPLIQQVFKVPGHQVSLATAKPLALLGCGGAAQSHILLWVTQHSCIERLHRMDLRPFLFLLLTPSSSSSSFPLGVSSLWTVNCPILLLDRQSLYMDVHVGQAWELSFQKFENSLTKSDIEETELWTVRGNCSIYPPNPGMVFCMGQLVDTEH